MVLVEVNDCGKDTFRRVLSLPSAVFQQCFQQWLKTLLISPEGELESQKHIAIDGKTVRRSHDRQHGLGPMHIVSAWASDYGFSLGQVVTEEKSNEVTAIPQLLDLNDVKDASVAIVAAGCQMAIAAKIVAGKGDYVLALKGNHEKLLDDVKLVMLHHLQNDVVGCSVSRHFEVEEGHGRLEARTYYQVTAHFTPSWTVRMERAQDDRRGRPCLRGALCREDRHPVFHQ